MSHDWEHSEADAASRSIDTAAHYRGRRNRKDEAHEEVRATFPDPDPRDEVPGTSPHAKLPNTGGYPGPGQSMRRRQTEGRCALCANLLRHDEVIICDHCDPDEEEEALR